MENIYPMVAKTFQGLEDVLRDELIELGAKNVELGQRMVSFEGDLRMMYKANLCCRTALRILKPIIKFTADTTDELYDTVRNIDWSKYMSPETTFAIDTTVSGNDFTHSRFVTYRVKDGIVDHFNDTVGKRPSIRLSGADLLFNVHISENRVTISLDSSGEPLCHRGYKVDNTKAPVNEVLAAGIIMKTGWRGDCDFADPMCGSGTFLIEAALIAGNINPGIFRKGFAFEKWPDFDADLFEELYNDDSEEKEFAYKIYGGDIDADAVAIARKNIKSAGVEDMIELERKSFDEWTEPSPEGVMVTNPPYGERLRPADIDALYASFGSTLKKYFAGWHVWVLGYKEEHFNGIGLKPSVKIPLHNGSLECSLREYVLFNGSYDSFRAEGGSVANKNRNEAPVRKSMRKSDAEWEAEARRFDGGKDRRDRKGGRPDGKFNKPRRDRKDGDFGGRDFRKDDRRDSFRKDDRRDGFKRDGFKRDDRRDGFRKDDRRDGFKRDSFKRDDRRDSFRKDDRRDGFKRDGFKRDDRRDGFRKDDRRDNIRKEDNSIRTVPNNGPKLSADSEVRFSQYKLRSRRKKEDPQDED